MKQSTVALESELTEQALVESLLTVANRGPDETYQHDLQEYIRYVMEAVTLGKALKNNTMPLFRYDSQKQQLLVADLGRSLYDFLIRSIEFWQVMERNQATTIVKHGDRLKLHPYAYFWVTEAYGVLKQCLTNQASDRVEQALDASMINDLKKDKPEVICVVLNEFERKLRERLLAQKKTVTNHQDSVRQNYRRLTAYTQKLRRNYKTLDVVSFTLMPTEHPAFTSTKRVRHVLNELLSAIKKENEIHGLFLGYAWKLKGYIAGRGNTKCYMEVVLFFKGNTTTPAVTQEIEKQPPYYSQLTGIPLHNYRRFTLSKQASDEIKQLFKQRLVSLTLTDEYGYYKPANAKAKTFAKTAFKSKLQKEKKKGSTEELNVKHF